MNSPKPLEIGDVIHGFARGAFGRDHYECVRIEAAGPDWIVARDAEGRLSFADSEKGLRFLISVRDEDRCEELECPFSVSAVKLTIPGGY